MVIKKLQKTGWGPLYFQLSREKTLEVRGDLIALEIEQREQAKFIRKGVVGGAVNIQLNGPG